MLITGNRDHVAAADRISRELNRSFAGNNAIDFYRLVIFENRSDSAWQTGAYGIYNLCFDLIKKYLGTAAKLTLLVL